MSRRQHQKSRHGCSQCKARRVKCDLVNPICGNCTRRLQACSFRESNQILCPVPSAADGKSLKAPNGSSAPPALSSQDLELLHHFSTHVYLTLSGIPEAQKLWQVDIPKDALQHDYLMYCILSLSSLHLFQTSGGNQPQEFYRTTGARYYDLALSGYRPHLRTITSENCEPLCAASCLLVFIAAAFSLVPNVLGRSDPIDDLIALSKLAKGVKYIVLGAFDKLRTGKMAPLLNPRPWDFTPLSEDIETALEALEARIEALTGVGVNRAIYFSTVQILKDAFKTILENPENHLLAVLFLVEIDRKFVELVRVREPMALVILLHYTVILHLYREHWWLGDRGQDSIKEVYATLDHDWRGAIAWPIEQLGLVPSFGNNADGLSKKSI